MPFGEMEVKVRSPNFSYRNLRYLLCIAFREKGMRITAFSVSKASRFASPYEGNESLRTPKNGGILRRAKAS
jgi:hypothetical protein